MIFLFFMFGFLTCLNDVLVPHLKALFDLTYGRAMLVQFCFFFAYFVGSIPFGKLVHWMGFRVGIIGGLCLAGTGAALFYPAASLQSFPIFLGALFILALGITLLQVAANPFVATLGPESSAESRLTLVQAFNSLGTTLAPLVGSVLLLKGLDAVSSDPDQHRLSQVTAIQTPYVVLSLMLFGLGFLFFLFPSAGKKRKPLLGGASAHAPINPGLKAPATSFAKGNRDKLKTLLRRHLVLGAVGIFAYVGSEVCIGSFLVSFFSDPKIAGISPSKAAQYVSFYWGGAMIGRFLGSWVMTRVSPARVLAFNGAMAALLVLVTLFTAGSVAMFSILAVGLFNSIMFPTLFTLAIQDMGEYSADASGLLCTAIVGGAVLPLVQGNLADFVGVHYAFVIPLLGYLYIIFYALKGSRVESLEA